MKNILITRFKRDVMREDIWNPLKKDYSVEYIRPNMKNLIKTLYYFHKNKKNWNKVILSSEPAFYPYLASIALGNKIEKIYFPCDIGSFRYIPYSKFLKKTISYIDWWFEKRLFITSDKIIHKGSENELEFLKYYDKIKNKPIHLIREFYNPDLTQEYNPGKKLSNKDGEIHLVYIGGFILDDTKEFGSFWNFYPKITNQNIHLHMYSEYLSDDIINKFREIEKENKYFHYEGRMKYNQLIKEMGKYDYGTSLFGISTRKHKIMSDVAYSLKIYDYVTACIPIICSENLKVVRHFVESNKFGFSVEYNNIDKLKEIIMKQDYETFIKNIVSGRKKLTSEKLVNFINK